MGSIVCPFLANVRVLVLQGVAVFLRANNPGEAVVTGARPWS